MTRLPSFLLVSFCNLTLCATAQAQMVDYGSLQDLYGGPVTTSATGTPMLEKDVPANMTIITADDIKHSGTRDIAKLLETVPGIYVMHSAAADFNVGVRGYEQADQPRLLVLINGRQVYLDDYSRTVWANLPVNIDDIRQIEVVKGPNAALFGVNAVAGVINIVTYNPLYDNNNVVSFMGGTQNLTRGSATLTHKLGDKVGLKLSGGGMRMDEFDTERGAVEAQRVTDPHRYYVSFDSLGEIKPGMQAGLGMDYARSNNTYALTNGAMSALKTESLSVKGNWAWQTELGTWKATTYWNRYRTDYKGLFDLPKLAFLTNLVAVQLEDQFQIGKSHTFRLSTEYRRNMFNFDAFQTFAQTPELAYNMWSAGGMWHWQMRDDLSLTSAVRLDRLSLKETGDLWDGAIYQKDEYSRQLTDYSANIGLVYQPTHDDTFRITFGRGIQEPSFVEWGINTTYPSAASPLLPPGTIYDLYGNPYIQPSVTQNYEVGYDRVLAPIASVLRVSVFYQTNDKIKGATTGGAVRVLPGGIITATQAPFANVGDSQAWGGELQLKGKSASGFRWNASYSFARVVDQQSVSDVVHNDGSMPRHMVRLGGGYSYQKWDFDTLFSYLGETNMLRNETGDQTGIGVRHTSGYVTLSGRIAYKLNDNFTFAVSGSNITSLTTQESAFPAVERQALVSVTARF